MGDNTHDSTFDGQFPNEVGEDSVGRVLPEKNQKAMQPISDFAERNVKSNRWFGGSTVAIGRGAGMYRWPSATLFTSGSNVKLSKLSKSLTSGISGFDNQTSGGVLSISWSLTLASPTTAVNEYVRFKQKNSNPYFDKYFGGMYTNGPDSRSYFFSTHKINIGTNETTSLGANPGMKLYEYNYGAAAGLNTKSYTAFPVLNPTATVEIELVNKDGDLISPSFNNYDAWIGMWHMYVTMSEILTAPYGTQY